MSRVQALSLITALLFCLFLATLPAYPSAVNENVLRIQKAYEGIKDLQGSFIQKNTIKALNRTDTYKGYFYIKYPFRMKWIYKGKSSQDITINQDTVLIYRKGDNQAYRTGFNREIYGQTPVALLSGFGNISKEFDISASGKHLLLKPKSPIGNITEISIDESDGKFPIRSFTIKDGSSNIIDIELRDVQTNKGIKDSVFELTLPEGVDIYEQ